MKNLTVPSSRIGSSLGKGLTISIKEGITKDSLMRSLETILGELGCLNCGFNGFDHIHFDIRTNPAIFNLRNIINAGKLQDVLDINFSQEFRQF